ncbi:hypothetical protein [Corynebacterium argentoratense]|uniref:hypothetical protein n=1 Tax=Corynebacterium argentoratense TaxID=42817 RepID=UPI001F380247|nr:hypothetical protein [Corynebacterium argentoratense]MCF1694296.1 hypothetical protein [Corynebacterium argentoratense]MCF1735867.1 hypothetical protein [Corynebacterium argentoratense]
MFEKLTEAGISIVFRADDTRPVILQTHSGGDTPLEIRLSAALANEVASQLQRAAHIAQSAVYDGIEGDVPLAIWQPGGMKTKSTGAR